MVHEIDAFLTYLDVERNAAPKTREAYSRDLNEFTCFLLGHFEGDYEIGVVVHDDDVKIESICREDIRSFLEYGYDRGLRKSTIERKVAALKTFFDFLYRRDYITKNPAEKISYPRKGKRLPKFLHNKEILEILDFPLETLIDYRDRAILETLYASGCRVSEIAGADRPDLDLDGKRLKVFGKGREERFVFLTDDAVKSLAMYIRERKKKFGSSDGPLFANCRGMRLTVRGIFYIVTRRFRQAGHIEKLGPHTFRHSFATELLNEGADLRAVQEMLGHKSLSTTQKYTHTTTAGLKKLYDRSHPHAIRFNRNRDREK